MRRGGVIALDNVLWYGRVADPKEADKATCALRDLNAFLLDDERIDLSIVPVGDGMALCHVR
jgi:predicted O-methyltransferase YrrM